MRRPVALLGCALVSAIGCAQTPLPVEKGFRPFAGERSARVSLRAPDGQGVGSAAGLVERLTALGVRAKLVRASADRAVVRLERVRDPAALVRAVARPDWWRFELLEPEPEPAQISVEVSTDVTAAPRPLAPTGKPNGKPMLSSRERVRAFVVLDARREVLLQDPRAALEDASRKDDPAWIAATREPRLLVEAEPQVARRIGRWTSENVGRPLALVVGSEVLLVSPVHNGERLELTLSAEDRSTRLDEALLRVLGLRAEVGTLEIE